MASRNKGYISDRYIHPVYKHLKSAVTHGALGGEHGTIYEFDYLYLPRATEDLQARFEEYERLATEWMERANELRTLVAAGKATGMPRVQAPPTIAKKAAERRVRCPSCRSLFKRSANHDAEACAERYAQLRARVGSGYPRGGVAR